MRRETWMGPIGPDLRDRRAVVAAWWLVLLVAGTLGGCGGGQVLPEGRGWQSPRGHGHPLAGRIWSQRAGGFVADAALLDAVVRADLVLLGEKHDNPDHHRLQAWVLQQLIARGRRPAVLFEMLSSENQAALTAWRAAEPADAEGLGPAVGWDQSGWPPWLMYRPIAQAALDARLVIAPANLTRHVVKAIAFGGPEALDADTRKRLDLDRSVPPEVDQAMRQEVVDSHCGMLPLQAAGPMALAQRARDAHMARAMLALGATGGAVLIAGKGHTRIDRGVPLHLRAFAPDRSTASVHFVEVPDQVTQADAAAYAKESAGDFVWFTARVDNDDPCEKYKGKLRSLRHRKMPAGSTKGQGAASQ